MKNDDPCLILTTAASGEEADAIARALVEERLAACCTVLPAVHSTYRWEGRVMQDQECMLLIKTICAAYPEVERRIRELHSYSLPEILCLPVLRGFESYIGWLQEAVADRTSRTRPDDE